MWFKNQEIALFHYEMLPFAPVMLSFAPETKLLIAEIEFFFRAMSMLAPEIDLVYQEIKLFRSELPSLYKEAQLCY
jgi:hypothetical protein